MQTKQTGFSLLELMVTVAIVAILMTVALPAYQDQVRKSKRAEARNLLLEAASKQQRFFSNNNQYAPSMNDLGYKGGGNNQATESGAYNVSVTNFTLSSYTLEASTQGNQVNDGCGNLTITHTGQKGKSGALALKDCWN